MGGLGSGRHAYGGKRTVEDCLSLDVIWMRRRGSIQPGASGNCVWSRRGAITGQINWRRDERGLTLTFRHRTGGEDWQNIEQALPIVWTLCRFGGQRPWFQCPGIINGRHCGRRVLKVYLGDRYFLCRHCYGLAYGSQSESALDRLARRADKLRERLGGEIGFDACPPLKPKGMHWLTYLQRMDEIERANQIVGQAIEHRLNY